MGSQLLVGYVFPSPWYMRGAIMRRQLHVNGWALLCGLAVPLLLGLTGCLATQGWVQKQLTPLGERVSDVEGRLGHSEARFQLVSGRADVALDRLDNLRLERRYVLNLKDGAQFDVDSAAMTQETRRQIDRFVDDTKGANDTLFVVVGHTDSTGSENYNFELGQKRAASVARYLITRKKVDPLRVTAVSYGANAPLADNTTHEGRRKNRRIEILVYKENITSSPGNQRLDLERAG
jgi:outer membrane protein OmpA-like peptidoglycan-associated protein